MSEKREQVQINFESPKSWHSESQTQDTVLTEQSKVDICYKFGRNYRIVSAIFVRCVLAIHASVSVWLVASLRKNNLLWLLLLLQVLIIVEAAHKLVVRGGKENKWVCPCFMTYLIAVLPTVWLVELHRLSTFNDALSVNGSDVQLAEINGLFVPVKLEPNLWISIMEQTLLFLLVLCRWLLPRGEITREQLSQLLFVFLGIASDNMELFQLFDETDVRKSRPLTYVILIVWSLSLSQFVFVLTTTHRSDDNVVKNDNSINLSKIKRKKNEHNAAYIVFSTEIWSLLYSVLVQDGPYLAVRVYIVVRYNLITYSIIFFICKNILVISLVIYRLIAICAAEWVDNQGNKINTHPFEEAKRTTAGWTERRDKIQRARSAPIDPRNSRHNFH